MTLQVDQPTPGEYLRFFMHEGRRHHGVLLYDWMLQQARTMGLHGGTAFRSIAGFGRHGVMHEEHFLELAGQATVRVDFVVTHADAERLIACLREENLPLFYARLPAQFGTLGSDASP